MNAGCVFLKRLCRRELLAGIAAISLMAGMAAAQVIEPVEPPKVPLPLDRVAVPDVNLLGLLDCSGPGLSPGACGGQYPGFPITNQGMQNKLIVLGKALFWDMQVGSDGIQACASCHFHAGADNRIRNQLSPGLKREGINLTQIQLKNAINPSQLPDNPHRTFTGPGGPNTTLNVNDFPFPVTGGGRLFGNNDVVSSQGVHQGNFEGLSGDRVENGNTILGQDVNGFNLNGSQTTRRVEPRNTPTTIGAVFNLRNFWDGRANMFFNGVNPVGMLDPAARVSVANQSSFAQTQIQLMIPFSSLASQAVGPPLSDFEMSLSNRTFERIGAKMLAPGLIPLDHQAVSTFDSVLGTHTTGVGLTTTYVNLIKEVFQPKFWRIDAGGNDLTLMRRNFALFFGLAVQAYEATLVPSDTPVDDLLRVLNGAQPNANTTTSRVPNVDPPGNPGAVERGLAVFLSGRSGCSGCHFGSETTSASVSHLTGFGDPAPDIVAGGIPLPPVALVERMPMGDGTRAAYDTGFYNIGVRPTADDLSIFGRVNNVPFSLGMLAQEVLRNNAAVRGVRDLLLRAGLRVPTSPTNLAPRNFAVTVACAPTERLEELGFVNGRNCTPLTATEPMAIRGSFKTPSLRNLKFTGPYFHNGSKKTIREVIDFYNVGGHFNMAFNPDNCRVNGNTCRIGQVDFDADIEAGRIRDTEINDVIAFLEALTDRRVARDAAPFDHPQLCVPHGHNADGSTILVDLPAVGAGGHGVDIVTFEETLQQLAGRPHSMPIAHTCGPALTPAP